MTNPSPVSTPPHFQLPPSNQFTAHGTAIGADHPYTRAHSDNAPPYSHPRPHIHPTQGWPKHDATSSTYPTIVSPTSASPGSSPRSQSRQQFEHGTGPSTIPDKEQADSPMTSSPHMASDSAEFAPQPASFDHKEVETHSGKKRHKCNVCGSYWGRPSSLKIHMVSHTGVKGA